MYTKRPTVIVGMYSVDRNARLCATIIFIIANTISPAFNELGLKSILNAILYSLGYVAQDL